MYTNQIRKFRQQAGLSQTKLACKIGIAASTLSNFENEKMEPWPKARKAISKALGIKETDLFPKEKDSGAASLPAQAPKSTNQSINGGYPTHGD